MSAHILHSADTETAFTTWKAIREQINNSGPETDSGDHALWMRLQKVEERIMQSGEVGPRVAKIRLWAGLIKLGLLYQPDHEAADRGDADWLLQYARSGEQQNKAILYAIKALRGENVA